MSGSFADLERHQFLSRHLVEELSRRRLPVEGGWGHSSAQFGTEATSLALLSLCSSQAGSFAMKRDLPALLAKRRSNGTWPATADGVGKSVWATALAVNTLTYAQANPAMIAPSIDALVQSRPLEASRFVRLKFRFSDRQVRFDPTKYGWPWVPGTVSWVLPTSVTLIALQRARRQGLVAGKEVETRLSLGAEMLLDRACVGGGWNAGNAVVYGVPLRPHIDATAIALAALRPHHQNPIVRDSLTWLLARVDCPSAYSLAWLILGVGGYRDVRDDVIPTLTVARDRLAALVEDPRGIQDTSTIALAALALRVDSNDNPFEVTT